MKKELKDTFLGLVRTGIGHECRLVSEGVNWNELQILADKHGLSAIVLDGIDKSPALAETLPVAMKLEWIGQVLQNYEQRYSSYEKAHVEMARFYSEHGYKMMVLKGYACSLDWLKPGHRPAGDIDIWQFGKQKDADALLAREKGIKVDVSHHHHTVFEWKGFTVENHYDFINVYHHKSNKEYEAILKELGSDDSHHVEVQGEKIFLPSPNLHALFLLKHLMMHFASEGVTLRQILDWGFFVEKHSDEIEWDYVLKVLDRFGMRTMFNIINTICVGDLGFDVTFFPTVQFEPVLKDMVIDEILEPRFEASVPKGFIKRIVYKLRRWKANEWKHKLCYNESMWSAFWSGVWNHLLKPSSI